MVNTLPLYHVPQLVRTSNCSIGSTFKSNTLLQRGFAGLICSAAASPHSVLAALLLLLRPWASGLARSGTRHHLSLDTITHSSFSRSGMTSCTAAGSNAVSNAPTQHCTLWTATLWQHPAQLRMWVGGGWVGMCVFVLRGGGGD